LNPETANLLQRRVNELHNLPAMPTVLRSLGECLGANPSDVNLERIVELISYDKSLVAQCLRIANSAMFRRRAEVDSIRSAVMALGVSRIRDIVYSCALPGLLAGSKDGMAPVVFWRHALGTALVSQHLAQRFEIENCEKFYLAGLLHDIGILVNSLLFREEFQRVLQEAEASETPLFEVEARILGFTHCDTGTILAGLWNLPADVSAAIERHHHPMADHPNLEMICTVYLADLLCRLRNLGYGYYEAREFDLAAAAPWRMLQEIHPAAADIDLARFTLELDEHAVSVQELVDSIFTPEKTPA